MTIYKLKTPIWELPSPFDGKRKRLPIREVKLIPEERVKKHGYKYSYSENGMTVCLIDYTSFAFKIDGVGIHLGCLPMDAVERLITPEFNTESISPHGKQKVFGCKDKESKVIYITSTAKYPISMMFQKIKVVNDTTIDVFGKNFTIHPDTIETISKIHSNVIDTRCE